MELPKWRCTRVSLVKAAVCFVSAKVPRLGAPREVTCPVAVALVRVGKAPSHAAAPNPHVALAVW